MDKANIMFTVTDNERKSVLVALKHSAPASTNDDNAMIISIHKLMQLSDAKSIVLRKGEFFYTKNALDKLVKMFLELESFDDVYSGAKLALGKFAAVPDIEAEAVQIKLCNEIEPLTIEESLALVAVASDYSAHCKIFLANGGLDKLKPEYRKTMDELVADLDNAIPELMKPIQNVLDNGESDDLDYTPLTRKAIRAVLVVCSPIIYNREPGQPGHGVDEGLIGLLTSASQKMELLSGIAIEKIELGRIDFSHLFDK